MNLDDIHSSPRIPLERHPRYAEFRQLIGQRDFAAYREVFERGQPDAAPALPHGSRSISIRSVNMGV